MLLCRQKVGYKLFLQVQIGLKLRLRILEYGQRKQFDFTKKPIELIVGLDKYGGFRWQAHIPITLV